MGFEAPDFSLKATDDKTYSLADFKHKPVLVIVFMCNHCPYVQAVWSRLNDLQKEFMEKGVQFIGINPNLHPDYPEESMNRMKNYYERYEMNFPYLQDETQEVAKAYGAVCTPDIFVFNDERRLSYHGRIDDNWENREHVKREELKAALESLVRNETPALDQYPSMGCSIKWKE